jgi:hypothetical protein
MSPPFWANAVAESSQVVYDGMLVNATNTDATFAGQKYEILRQLHLEQFSYVPVKASFGIPMVSPRLASDGSF